MTSDIVPKNVSLPRINYFQAISFHFHFVHFGTLLLSGARPSPESPENTASAGHGRNISTADQDPQGVTDPRARPPATLQEQPPPASEGW
jgi:hypothetical protein